MLPEEFLTFLESKIGSKGTLIIDTGLYKGTYSTRLEDIRTGFLGVAHPTLRGALLPVMRNVELKVRIEADGGIYQAPAAVIRNSLSESVPLLWVAPVGEAEKIQRRSFVRVPSTLRVSLFKLSELAGGFDLREWVQATVKDISLGGVGMSAPAALGGRFNLKERFFLRFALSGVPFLLAAALVRKNQTEDRCDLGFAFEQLPVILEKTLVTFIRQSELAGR